MAFSETQKIKANLIVAMSATTAITLALCSPLATAAEAPGYINTGREENLGNHMKTISTTDMLFTKLPNGTPVAVAATSGFGSTVNVIDLNTRKTIRSFTIGSMTREKQQYASYSTGNGHAFLGFSNGEIYDVDIVNGRGTLIQYPKGTIKPDFIWDVAEGDNGDIYFGTYRSGGGGTIIKYNVKTKKVTDLGIVDNTAKYVRSIAYDNGKIYAGMGTGKGRNGIVEIDAKNPSRKRTFYQDFSPAENNNVSFIANLTAHNGYLYAVPDSKYFKNEVLVYDIKNRKWVHRITESQHMGNQVIPYSGNTVLMKNSQGFISQYDPVKRKLTPLVTKNLNGSTRTSGLIGNTVYTYDGRGVIRSVNLKDKSLNSMYPNDTKMVGTERQIEAIHESIDSEIFVAPFFPTTQIRKFSALRNQKDIYNDKSLIEYRQQQVQFIDTFADRYFITGAYPGGYVAITDRKNNGFKKVEIGNNQIRPTTMTAIDGRTIAVTSSPDYGQQNGGVSIIDVPTGKIKKYISIKNMVPSSITYSKGMVYVGLNRNPGGGAQEVEKSGKLIAIDPNSGKIVKEKVLLPNSREVHNVLALRNGRLFATSNEAMYEVDPKTFNIKQTRRDAGTGFFHKFHMIEAYNGIVVAKNDKASGKDQVLWIDPDNISRRKVLANGYIPEVSKETGDLYYRKRNNKDLYRMNYNAVSATVVQPAYRNLTLNPGESKTIPAPLNNGHRLSSKTKFTTGGRFPSWAKINGDGSISLNVPKNTKHDQYRLPVRITYQDGSQEIVTVRVNVGAVPSKSTTTKTTQKPSQVRTSNTPTAPNPGSSSLSSRGFLSRLFFRW